MRKVVEGKAEEKIWHILSFILLSSPASGEVESKKLEIKEVERKKLEIESNANFVTLGTFLKAYRDKIFFYLS